MMKLISIISIFLISISVNAQGILGIGAGVHTVGERDFTWSIGSVLKAASFSSTDLMVNQGVVGLPFKSESDGTAINEEPYAALQLELYPNPASQIVNVNLDANVDYYQLNVFDPLGVKVIESKVKGSSVTLDISHLSPGMYIVSLSSEKQEQTLFLMKE